MDTKQRIKYYLKVIIVALLFGIILGLNFPLTSAFEFDNVKEYNYNLREVTIKDSILGIPTTNVAKVRLVSPLHVTLFDSWDYAFELEITNYENNYANYIKKIETYNYFNLKDEKSGGFVYKYWNPTGGKTVKDYKETCDLINNTVTCTETEIGSHIEYTGAWETFNEKTELKTGTYRIRGYWTEPLKSGERIEWIPTLFGVRVEEWADFGLATKTEYEESVGGGSGCGTVTNSECGQSFRVNGMTSAPNGFIIQGFSFYINVNSIGAPCGVNLYLANESGSAYGDALVRNISGDGDMDCAVSFGTGWRNFTLPNYTLVKDQRYVVSGNGTGQFELHRNQTSAGGGYVGNASSIENGEGGLNGTAQVRTLSTGLWSIQDDRDFSFAVWGEVIGYDAPIVDLNSPADAFTTKETSLEFNCSSYDALGPINLTLIVDDVPEITVTNSTANETLEVYYNKSGLSIGSYNWTCESWNANDVQSFGTNRSFSISVITENEISFNATTTESASESFTYNISYNSAIYTSITGNLIYNGTSYATVQSGSDDDRAFKTSFDVPITISGNQENRTFYWEIGLTNASGTNWYNSSLSTQTVDIMTFTYCNSTAGQFINFTIFDYSDPNKPFVNATFESAWEFSISGGNGSILKNYTYQNLSETVHEFVFCFSPVDNNYTVNTQIEYQKSGYAKNYYYLNDYLLTNASESVNLYLLNDTDATATLLQVVDRARNPVGDIYITIQSYDTGTDTYYTTAMARTSSLGEDLAYLNWYDTFYKFILVENGSIIKIEGPQKITETPQTFEYSEAFISSFDKFEDFEYDLYYNDNTSNVVLTFIKPSGSVDSGCLRVTKRNITNDYEICNQCETSSSATIYCNIAGQGNGTFIGEFYATGSLKYIGYITAEIGSFLSPLYDTLGQTEGTVYAMMFAITVVTLFLFSPTLAILGLLIGMFLGTVLGFQPMHQAEFIGIALVGGIIIWLINR